MHFLLPFFYRDEEGRTAFLNATAGNYIAIMRALFAKFGRGLTLDTTDKVGVRQSIINVRLISFRHCHYFNISVLLLEGSEVKRI